MAHSNVGSSWEASWFSEHGVYRLAFIRFSLNVLKARSCWAVRLPRWPAIESVIVVAEPPLAVDTGNPLPSAMTERWPWRLMSPLNRRWPQRWRQECRVKIWPCLVLLPSVKVNAYKCNPLLLSLPHLPECSYLSRRIFNRIACLFLQLYDILEDWLLNYAKTLMKDDPTVSDRMGLMLFAPLQILKEQLSIRILNFHTARPDPSVPHTTLEDNRVPILSLFTPLILGRTTGGPCSQRFIDWRRLWGKSLGGG